MKLFYHFLVLVFASLMLIFFANVFKAEDVEPPASYQLARPAVDEHTGKDSIIRPVIKKSFWYLSSRIQ